MCQTLLHEIPVFRVEAERRVLRGHALEAVDDLRQGVYAVRLELHRQLLGQVVLVGVHGLQVVAGQRLLDVGVVGLAAVPAGVGDGAALEQRLPGGQVVGNEGPAAAPVGQVPVARDLGDLAVAGGQGSDL